MHKSSQPTNQDDGTNTAINNPSEDGQVRIVVEAATGQSCGESGRENRILPPSQILPGSRQFEPSAPSSMVIEESSLAAVNFSNTSEERSNLVDLENENKDEYRSQLTKQWKFFRERLT